MIALESLLCSIAESVQSSQNSIRQNAYSSFMKYFTEEYVVNNSDNLNDAGNSTVLMPHMEHFRINDSPDGADIEVPAVALVNHNSMVLDKVKIVLNVSGVSDGEHFMVNTEPGNGTNDTEHHQVTLEFKQTEPSEGMARVLTTYNQSIG